MFTRFFHAKIKPGKGNEFKSFYTAEILPALHQAPGCLYASLIRSVEDPNEFISFSLWDTQGSIRGWEQSSKFSVVLNKAKQLFAGSSEWRVQLTTNLELEYIPVSEEPVVRSYREATAVEPHELSRAFTGQMFVRLLSVKVAPGKLGELREIYKNEVIPTLKTVSGCRYAFLVDSAEENEIISVTIWNSKDDAAAYETSGVYESLVEKTRHTFSQAYQWKMQLAEETQGATVTSEDISVKPYQVVVGKRLG
jgi:heme-degrading monooxygenase HmoA